MRRDGLRIIIPHTPTLLCDETRAWGQAHGAEFRDVSGSDYAYFELLSRVWRDGHPFVWVEHDMVPPPDAIEDFVGCEEPWCGHPFRHPACLGANPLSGALVEHGVLGCVRFSAALLRRFPDAIEGIADEREEDPWPEFDRRVWWVLDERVRLALERRRLEFHKHSREAAHVQKDAVVWREIFRRDAHIEDHRRFANDLAGWAKEAAKVSKLPVKKVAPGGEKFDREFDSPNVIQLRKQA